MERGKSMSEPTVAGLAIEYEYPLDSPGTRFARARCAHCPRKFELHQRQSEPDGSWAPAEQETLETAGWQRRPGQLFCSTLCLERFDRAKAKAAEQVDRWEEIERVGRQAQTSDMSATRFAHAWAAAALFELKVRIFADTTPELQRYFGADLDALVDRIVEHLGATLRDDEVKHLKKAVRVRGELLHPDFSKAAGKDRVFGWLMEGADRGAFDEARALFVRCIDLIEWLLAGGTGNPE